MEKNELWHYGINELRLFFENNLKFLQQFFFDLVLWGSLKVHPAYGLRYTL
jgi:hypothetical protein